MSMVDSVNTINTADYNIYYMPDDGVDNIDGEGNGQFSELLTKALDELKTNTLANSFNTGMPEGLGAGAMPGGFSPLQGMLMPSATDTLERAILSAADSGKSEDAMVALLMLLMIMQTGSGEGDSSMMMQMMAAMIGQLQEKDTLRDQFLYRSGGDPYTLDTIDANVFGTDIQKLTETVKADLPLQWWRPTTPVVTSTVNDRDPRLYRAVVDQFEVETAERYRPGREGHTYCNVYVWDVTRAMGAELPYYSDPATGAPREYPDTKGANTNGAIAMDRWLKTHGEKYGWHQVTAEEAQMHANQGKPAVTAAADVGHVQMIVPSKDGTFDPVRGVTIAQAGRTVSNYMHISGIYGSASMKKVTYWVHD